ncbi:hypothetical protein [Paracoccus laeviglucosivorans]|uniref:Dolichyl-phosphate-mannose-protein mannosyltransferase n=1 Tax=Paracoccus laeviglucosivorans TaxID=1197861 RepID=A0A521E337_9RHOB|nr:hypothetical protein [Paracoccus laeviglucosivorans]SMO78376.1 hypothetical protein SAMN06265221_11121 [Paracoccus laeviglucosivorans]
MFPKRHLPFVFAALVPLLMLLVVAQTPVEPWGDEAMLITNLLVPDLNIFAPLPHYEQAAPVGYLWLSRQLLEIFGAEPPFHVLRYLSALFIGLGVVLILSIAPIRRDWMAKIIVVALLLGSPMIWIYANEIKHYSAEFFASALVLACGIPLVTRSDMAALSLFLLAVVVAGLVSFTVPVVVAGMLMAIAVMRLRSDQPDRLAPAVVVTAVLAMVYLGAIYLFLNRGLVVWQIQAYAHVYSPEAGQGLAGLLVKRLGGLLDAVVNAFGPSWLSRVQGGLHLIGLPLGLSYHAIRLIALALFAALVIIARKSAPGLVGLTLGVFAAVAVLQLAGMLHLSYPRHAIFLMPFTAALMAISLSRLLGASLPQKSGAVIVATALVMGLWLGIGTALTRQTQELGKMLAHIRDTAPEAPVWINGSGQPVFELLAPRPNTVLGEMDSASGPVAWQVRGAEFLPPAQHGGEWLGNPDYPQSIAAQAAGQTELWLLFNNDPSAQDRIPFLSVAAKTVGPCNPAIEGHGAGLYYCARQGAAN